MSNLKLVSRVTRNYEGWFIGFRRWELRAYDENNNMVCEITEWENNNYLKYVKFLIKLRQAGYDVTEAQRRELKSEPFLLKEYIPQVRKEHLIEIANLCSYTESYINLLPTLDFITKQKFAYDVGLEIEELEMVIKHFS
jgi:hypothetical protein